MAGTKLGPPVISSGSDSGKGSASDKGAARGASPIIHIANARGYPHSGEPRRIVMIGRQGAGKSVQCGLLTRRLRIPFLSVTEEYRRAVRDRTPLGKALSERMKSGVPIPDHFAIKALATELAFNREHGFVIDGFPMTLPQARALIHFLGPHGIDCVVCLDVPGLFPPQVCEYLARYYRLVHVDGVGDVEVVAGRVWDALHQYQGNDVALTGAPLSRSA